MEEILASIRRIISEDDQPVAASASAVDATPPHGDDEADILELTHKVEPTTGGDLGGVVDAQQEDETLKGEAAGESIGDLDVFSAAPTPANQTSSQPAQKPPAPAPVASGSSIMREPALVSEPAASAAASKFGALEQTLSLDRGVSMPSGQTMDAVIREMLNPLLQAWLDQNLEAIVDAKVQAEIDRIARRR